MCKNKGKGENMDEKEFDKKMEKVDELIREAENIVNSMEEEFGDCIRKNKVIEGIKTIFLAPGNFLHKEKNKEDLELTIMPRSSYNKLCDNCRRIIDEENWKEYNKMTSHNKIVISMLTWGMLIIILRVVLT